MSKKSNKNKAQKLEKARQFNASFDHNQFEKKLDSIISAETENPINLNPLVAINPAIKEKFEDPSHFILIFDDYNDKECQLYNLDKTKARSLISKFKNISSCNEQKLPLTNIIRSNIARQDKYKSLYTGLSPDIVLKETEFSGGGRIFFHIVQRYFCVVAIKTQHINLD